MDVNLTCSMELNHTSATAYMGDNYNEENICPTMQPKGWLHYIKGHPCYNPEKVGGCL